MTEIVAWLVVGSMVLGVGGSGCLALVCSFVDDYRKRKHNRQMTAIQRQAKA